MANNIPAFTRAEDFSLTHYVSKNYAEWESSASGFKSFFARPFAVISMPLTGTIDTIAHAVLALVKISIAIMIGMPWSFVATVFNTRTPPSDIKITSVIVHLYAMTHSALCGITLPVIILLDPDKAARLSSRSQQDLIDAENLNHARVIAEFAQGPATLSEANSSNNDNEEMPAPAAHPQQQTPPPPPPPPPPSLSPPPPPLPAPPSPPPSQPAIRSSSPIDTIISKAANSKAPLNSEDNSVEVFDSDWD